MDNELVKIQIFDLFFILVTPTLWGLEGPFVSYLLKYITNFHLKGKEFQFIHFNKN